MSHAMNELWDLEHLPWVWLGLLFLILLFTPLGRIWPLAWVVLGAGVLFGNLKARDAIAFAVIAIVAGTFTAANWSDLIPSNPKLEAEVPEVQLISLEGLRRIELHTFNGAIKVTNAPGPAKLIVRRKGGVNVLTKQADEVLNVQAKRPFFAWNTAASFELILPAPQPLDPGLTLALTTTNSPIEVLAKAERLELSNSGGRITVRDTGAKFSQLVNNNAEIEVSKVMGTLEASTNNAAIRVTEAKDAQLKLETSNGMIRLEAVQLANVRSSARTSNAPIEVSALKALSGLIVRGETVNASLDLNLPGFELARDGQRFEAKRGGLSPAELELVTANARIVMKP